MPLNDSPVRRMAMLGTALAALALAGPAMAQECPEQATLTFTFWGSASERADVEAAIANFNETRPCITVQGQHIPSTGYVERLTTMLAGDILPDVAYLGENLAFAWATEGRILDLTPYMGETPEDDYVRSTIYRADDVLLGTGLATGVMLIYYNKDVFDEVGVDYPPSNAAEAWSWDEFVDIAKTLTRDGSGNNAHSPDFNPDDIQAYGITLGTGWTTWYPFVISNGGEFASEDGTQLLLNQPEAVEALQNLQDLIYVHHAAPTPTVAGTLPAADIQMMSRRVAMSLDGMWRVTDFADTSMNWSIGVLPVMSEPATVLVSTPKVIFADTEYPDAAFEFYQYISDPAQVGLFKSGLWAPHELDYFSDEELLATWVTAPDGAYPPESMGAIVDYTLNYTPQQAPVYWVRNIGQIMNDAVIPNIQRIFAGTATAQEAMDDAVAQAEGLMQGRW